jgi:hypothetical protein
MTESYSIKEHIDQISEETTKSLDKISETAEKTLIQATKTNGRVNMHSFQFKILWMGFGMIISFLSVAIPIGYRYMKLDMQDSIKQTVDESVRQALITYNIIHEDEENN